MTITKRKLPDGWIYFVGHIFGFAMMGIDESVSRAIRQELPIAKTLEIKYIVI